MSVYSIVKIKSYEVVEKPTKQTNAMIKILFIHDCAVIDPGIVESIEIGNPVNLFEEYSKTNSNVITKIQDLHNMPNNWTIRCKVISKFPIKYWSNDIGAGKLFNVDVFDETGQIRIVAFRDLVDKFYQKIDVGMVYEVSKSAVRFANQNYSPKNKYEIVLTDESIIEHIDFEFNKNVEAKSNLKKIRHIFNCEKNDIVDLVAMCKKVPQVNRFTAKSNGKEYRKRDIVLCDDTGEITLTLWNEDADAACYPDGATLLIKEGKVNEFNDVKHISKTATTIMQLNPNIREANALCKILKRN